MKDQKSKNTPPRGEVPLLHYVIIVAAHRKMIFYSTIAATVITYLVLFILPNKYTASALIAPPRPNLTLSGKLLESLGGTSIAGEASPFGNIGSMLGLKDPADIYMGMLTSKTVFDRIIDRFKLRELYNKDCIEKTRDKLAKLAKIDIEKSGLISIKVTDESDKRATQMANAFVEELNALLQRMNHTEANKNLTFLENERDQSLSRLSKAEENVRCFSEQKNVLQIDAQTRGVLEYIATLRAAIDSKEVQLKVLRERATALNPELKNLNTEIKGLREKLADVEAKESNNICGKSLFTTSNVPLLGIEYMRLFREAKFQEGLYDLYCKLVELAYIDRTRSVDSVQVVDYAIPPERRSNMRIIPAVIVGFGIFIFAVFFAITLEYFKNIEDEETIREMKVIKELTPAWLKKTKSVFGYLKRTK